MENHNDCVNNSTVVNYYHRLGFPCTEALYVSSTHFRLLIVPKKSFSKESPIFKPADTFLISCKYMQKEGFLSEEQTVVLGVIYRSPHPRVHLLSHNSPLMTLYKKERSCSQDWLQAPEPSGSCPLIPTCSADL